MILTCPACGTRFHIDAAAIGAGGRKVRCAKCKHLWFAEAPDDLAHEIEAETEIPAAGPPASEAARTPPPSRAGDRGGYVWLGLSALLVVVAGLVVGRHDIVAAYPPAADIYRKLYLPIQLPPTLELADVSSARLFEAGVSILVVEGAIVNISDEVQPVPGVRIALLGEQGRELVAETVDTAKGELSAGERTEFEIRLVDPPPEASNFRVSLLEVGG